MNELIEQVKAIPAIKVYKEQLTDDEKKLIEKAYNRAGFKFKKSNCNNCYEKAYLYFKNITTQIMDKISKSNFKLIDGKKIMMHGMTDVITNANLTDDKALHILKRTPGAIKLFTKFPKDWKEQAEKFDILAAARKDNAVKRSENLNDAAEAPKETVVDVKVSEKKTEREILEEKSKEDLKAIALSLEIDEKEFKGLNKTKLIDLLIKHTS